VPQVLDLVIVVEDMLGFFPKMRYADHDVSELSKFLELVSEVYMEKRGSNLIGIPILEPKQCVDD
jgi:hypothetical protein